MVDRNLFRSNLEIAVKNTCIRFPRFQGVILFGSFVTDKPQPNDLDLIPVMSSYDGNWDFSPISEDDACDDSPDYLIWKEIEDYFLTHFPLLPEDAKIKGDKRGKGKNRGIHYETLVALDNPILLRKALKEYKASIDNFVGNEEAKRMLVAIYAN